jgi:hypothetical protein
MTSESFFHLVGDGDTEFQFSSSSFVTTNLTLADLATPLYGPVLRLQVDLPVTGRPVARAGDNFEGEWPSLDYTNWLLDQRFGQRPRPYATHTSKTFLKPILLEMEAIWGEEFAKVSLLPILARITPDTGTSRQHQVNFEDDELIYTLRFSLFTISSKSIEKYCSGRLCSGDVSHELPLSTFSDALVIRGQAISKRCSRLHGRTAPVLPRTRCSPTIGMLDFLHRLLPE